MATQPGRTRTRSADIGQALIAAAEAVLERDGPTAVSVRTVAAEAGVAPMGIYNHLHGKDGLIDGLLIRGFDALRAAVAHQGEPDPVQRLRASGIRYRAFALAHPQYYALMFQDAIPRTTPSAQVGEHARAAFGELVANVTTAASAGRLSVSDPVDTAQQIWAALHGAVALELSSIGFTLDPAATYQAMLDTLLRGLSSTTTTEVGPDSLNVT